MPGNPTHFQGKVYAEKADNPPDGLELTDNPVQAAIADITTDMSADANDNELKGKVNAILAALRSANIIST